MARIRGFLRQESGVALIEFAFVFPIMLLLIFAGIELTRYIIINQKLEKAAYELANITTQYAPATPDGAAKGFSTEISETAFRDSIFPLMDRMMSPYNDPKNISVIVSSFVHQQNRNLIRWQIGSVYTGNHSFTGYGAGSTYTSLRAGYFYANGNPGDSYGYTVPKSSVTTSGYRPRAEKCVEVNWWKDPPTGYVRTAFNNSHGAMENENTIVVEVFYNYKPILEKVLKGLGGFSLPQKTLRRRIFMYPRNGDLTDLPPNVPTPDTSVTPTYYPIDSVLGRCPN